MTQTTRSAFVQVYDTARTAVAAANEQHGREAWRLARTEYARFDVVQGIAYAINTARVCGEIAMRINAMSVSELDALVDEFLAAGSIPVIGDAANTLNIWHFGSGSLERGA